MISFVSLTSRQFISLFPIHLAPTGIACIAAFDLMGGCVEIKDLMTCLLSAFCKDFCHSGNIAVFSGAGCENQHFFIHCKFLADFLSLIQFKSCETAGFVLSFFQLISKFMVSGISSVVTSRTILRFFA